MGCSGVVVEGKWGVGEEGIGGSFCAARAESSAERRSERCVGKVEKVWSSPCSFVRSYLICYAGRHRQDVL